MPTTPQCRPQRGASAARRNIGFGVALEVVAQSIRYRSYNLGRHIIKPKTLEIALYFAISISHEFNRVFLRLIRALNNAKFCVPIPIFFG